MGVLYIWHACFDNAFTRKWTVSLDPPLKALKPEV